MYFQEQSWVLPEWRHAGGSEVGLAVLRLDGAGAVCEA